MTSPLVMKKLGPVFPILLLLHLGIKFCFPDAFAFHNEEDAVEASALEERAVIRQTGSGPVAWAANDVP